MKFLNTVVSHQIQKNGSNISEKLYLWGTNDKLLSVIADGKETRYEYDGWGNLSKTLFEDGKVNTATPTSRAICLKASTGWTGSMLAAGN